MGWSNVDMSASAKVTEPALRYCQLSAYADSLTSQHVSFVGEDFHVYEIKWDGSWHATDLTIAGGGAGTQPLPNGGQLVGFSLNRNPRVYYIGSDQSIQELANNGGDSWKQSNLTNISGSLLADRHSNLAAFNPDGNPRVFYTATDPSNNGARHLYQLVQISTTRDIWSHDDICARANYPTASIQDGSPIACYAAAGQLHVVCVGAGGSVLKFTVQNNGNNYGWENLTAMAKMPVTPAAGSAISCFTTGGSNTQQHIAFTATDGNIYQLIWNTSSWVFEMLVSASVGVGQGPSTNSSPSCFVTVTQSTSPAMPVTTTSSQQHVGFVRGSDLHISQNVWTGSKWVTQDVTSAAGAQVPVNGSRLGTYVAGSQQHFVFVEQQGHVCDIVWSA